MVNTLLYTVPHTGTHFVMKFLEVLELQKINDWFRYHAPRGPLKGRDWHEDMHKAVNANKLIVTARDPYLSAIRWIDPGRHRNIEQMAYSWKHLFMPLNKRKDYFIIDIGCRESDRVNHLCEAVDYLEINYDRKVVEDFALAWKPEYASNTGAKSAYLSSGALPNPRQGSWDMLDDAVTWYKSLPTNDFGDK